MYIYDTGWLWIKDIGAVAYGLAGYLLLPLEVRLERILLDLGLVTAAAAAVVVVVAVVVAVVVGAGAGTAVATGTAIAGVVAAVVAEEVGWVRVFHSADMIPPLIPLPLTPAAATAPLVT